jgi:hypothetical protein
VEVTLDPVAFGVGSEDEPLVGRAQFRDLDAQPIDLFPQRLQEQASCHEPP